MAGVAERRRCWWSSRRTRPRRRGDLRAGVDRDADGRVRFAERVPGHGSTPVRLISVQALGGRRGARRAGRLMQASSCARLPNNGLGYGLLRYLNARRRRSLPALADAADRLQLPGTLAGAEPGSRLGVRRASAIRPVGGGDPRCRSVIVSKINARHARWRRRRADGSLVVGANADSEARTIAAIGARAGSGRWKRWLRHAAQPVRGGPDAVRSAAGRADAARTSRCWSASIHIPTSKTSCRSRRCSKGSCSSRNSAPMRPTSICGSSCSDSRDHWMPPRCVARCMRCCSGTPISAPASAAKT